MTDKEKELIVYCLKANSYFHGEVCEECKNYPKCDHFQYDSLMEKLIKALEQEPCEDYISRQALLKLIGEEPFNWTDSDKELQEVEDYRNFRNIVEQLPSVNPQKIGHWIYDRTRDWDGECKYECSECGMGSDVDYAYCMRCGARMKGDAE